MVRRIFVYNIKYFNFNNWLNSVLVIMFNPSNGGDQMEDGQVDPTQADPTINKILRKDNNMTTDNGSEFTGVHIRNLFTYRTPYPRDLVQAFEAQMAELQEAEGGS